MWLTAGCGGETKGDPKAEAPPQTKVEHEEDVNLVQTDHPEQFPLVAATEYSVDVADCRDGIGDAGRVAHRAGGFAGDGTRGGDQGAPRRHGEEGADCCCVVQSADMSAAFSDYRKAVADEKLANTQIERAKLLYDKGAISLNDMQVAEDTEDKAKVDVENTTEHLKVLGGNIDHPAAVVDIVAPISGVITDQQVTNAAGIQGLGSPNPFTISDLSTCGFVCDVYENDLPNVHVGETAEIRLNAYPGKVLTGRISNVSPVLDPTIRTAKVRIEVANPGNSARGDVCHGDVPRAEERDARGGAGFGDFAFARSRLGVCAGGGQEVSAR